MGDSQKEGERGDTQELPPGVSPATVRNASRLPMFMQGWATRNHRRRHPLAVIVMCIALVLVWTISTWIMYLDDEHWLMSHTGLPVVFCAVMVALLVVSVVLGVRASRRVLRTSGELLVARQRYLAVVAGSLCAVFAVLLYAALVIGGDFELLAMHALNGLVIAGLGLLVVVFSAARRGSELRCAGCGYSFDHESGEVCPECGREWLGEGGLVRGGRRRGWALPAALFAVFVLPPVSLGLLLSFTDPTKHMPTGLVMRLAESQIALFDNPWHELGDRQLTDEQVRRLIESLIDRPWERRFPEGSNGGAWLLEQARLGRAPGDLLEHIIADMVEIELVAPEVARAGSEVEVRVEVRSFADRWPAHKLHVAFGGYTIGRSTAPLERAEQIHVVHAPAWGVPREQNLADPVVFTPDRAGEMRVAIDCWLFLDSALWDGAISWRLDGPPDPPRWASASLHIRRTATIRVLPAEEP